MKISCKIILTLSILSFPLHATWVSGTLKNPGTGSSDQTKNNKSSSPEKSLPRQEEHDEIKNHETIPIWKDAHTPSDSTSSTADSTSALKSTNSYNEAQASTDSTPSSPWLRVEPKKTGSVNTLQKMNTTEVQKLAYLGKIVAVHFKDGDKAKILGFKVHILNVKFNGDASLMNQDVYLPFRVALRDEVAFIPGIRNKEWTEMQYLDLDTSKFIEFESFAKQFYLSKHWGPLRTISKKPLISRVGTAITP